jgi:adenylate kinase
MKAIILLGAPGAGKGTAAEAIREATPYIHIATGDMLREAIKQGTELGRKASSYMKQGELAPDELMIKLVEDRLDSGSTKDAYMFDGFPRTMAQAELLDGLFEKKKARLLRVFVLQAPREVLISRLTGRRICRNCGRNYHVANVPPKKPGVCDICGGELYQRPDDTEATIINRLEVYNKQTESLICHYDRRGIVVRVDSSCSHDELMEQILKRLR